VFAHEALMAEPPRTDVVPPGPAAWATLRMARSPVSDPAFHGQAGPYRATSYSVTGIEAWLECPFKYFAAKVLRLDEDRPDDPLLAPRARGRFVHDVFRAFFEAWDAGGHGPIRPETLPDARRLFEEVAEACLSRVPEGDRAIERTRLLGSAASPGIGNRVLALEAEREHAVVERLLEFDLSGEYVFATPDGPRTLHLRGIADRLDLLEDATLRVLDYKSGRAPDPRRAIQLPVYAACAEVRLASYRGGGWTVGEAAYVALAGDKARVAAIESPAERDEALARGQERLLAAVDAIERGEFPPRPVDRQLCGTCAWALVCRRDYVDV
jgi:RecB family exonuclease